MNYEEMSDFEINKRVAECYGFLIQELDDSNSLGMTTRFNKKYPSVVWVADLDCSTLRQSEPWWQFDPCNNPADAWPIIFESRITIQAPSNGILNNSKCNWEASGDYPADDCSSICVGSAHKNPLRAAMICYLMMQEAK